MLGAVATPYAERQKVMKMYTVRPIALNVLNLSRTIAGTADLNLNLAVSHPSALRFILIEREDAVCKFVHRDYSATPDVKCHIGSVSATLAIRADNHSRLFATAGAVITAVSCAY
jgi:hypothetical protein